MIIDIKTDLKQALWFAPGVYSNIPCDFFPFPDILFFYLIASNIII